MFREGLAPPVASTLSISTTFAKEHLSLAFLAPPVAPNTVTLHPLQKDNNPSPRASPPKTALSFEKHYILASLVKGRWIDGKAQTVALLLSACDMPTLFIL